MASAEVDRQQHANRELKSQIDHLVSQNKELRDQLDHAKSLEHAEDGELAVQKRKAESHKKENETLKSQFVELKAHADSLAAKLSAKEKEIAQLVRSNKTAVTKKEETNSRDQMMRDLEVHLFHQGKRIETRKTVSGK